MISAQISVSAENISVSTRAEKVALAYLFISYSYDFFKKQIVPSNIQWVLGPARTYALTWMASQCLAIRENQENLQRMPGSGDPPFPSSFSLVMAIAKSTVFTSSRAAEGGPGLKLAVARKEMSLPLPPFPSSSFHSGTLAPSLHRHNLLASYTNILQSCPSYFRGPQRWNTKHVN